MNKATQHAVELDDLYQEIILDHFKHPRNAAKLTADEVLVDEENPTCGDQLKLSVDAEDGRISNIRYDARGCAISTASASMMSELAKGKSLEEALSLSRSIISMMRGQAPFAVDDLGDLIALEGIKGYPMRIKCATMCWHALGAAVEKLSTQRG